MTSFENPRLFRAGRSQSRLFAEIFLYLRQVKPPNPWRAIVIYPSRSADVGETNQHQELLMSSRVRRIYLNEIELLPDASLGSKLVGLIVAKEKQAIAQAKQLVQQTKQELPSKAEQALILDLIETIIVYKLPQLGRTQVQQMLGLTEIDIKQTKFYQDVFTEGKQEGKQEGREEGREEGETELLLRLLTRRLGSLEPSLMELIRRLNVSQRLDLAEATLTLTSVAELENWLQARQNVSS